MSSFMPAIKHATGKFGAALPAILSFCAPVLFSSGIVLWFILSSHPLPDILVPRAIALVVATLMALAPLMACMVQTISQDRQTKKLQSIINNRLKDTAYYKLAIARLDAIKPASVAEPDFRWPLIVFSWVISFCALVSFMGLFWPNYLESRSFILGGMHPPFGALPNMQNSDLAQYQSITLVAAGFAFIGAYIALFSRILGQLNNDDMYPISFYYYAAWLIAAMMIASIFRHIIDVYDGTSAVNNSIIVLVSFAIGAAPAPFFAALLRKAFKWAKILGDKGDPAENDLPTNLNLLMIDGIGRDKIDRLEELGVADAKSLSCQNPFTIWARLPYEFDLIVDWISQAQLYGILREDGFKQARTLQVTDIHRFVATLSDPKAAADFCVAQGMRPALGATTLVSLAEDPAYYRLREVRDAMRLTLTGDSGPAQEIDPTSK